MYKRQVLALVRASYDNVLCFARALPSLERPAAAAPPRLARAGAGEPPSQGRAGSRPFLSAATNPPPTGSSVVPGS